MRYVWTALGIVLVIGTLAAVKATQIGTLVSHGKSAAQAGPPPEAVATMRAEEQSWESTLSAVGSVASERGVTLSNEVPGVVTRIAFVSGAAVKKGQALVELDTSTERAQLAAARTRKSLATTTFERTRALVEKEAIARAQLDADEAQLRTSTKEVESIQADIDKKTIRAPFSGRAGIRQVSVGQYLNPGTPVTVVETPEAVHVDFSLPQQRLAEASVGVPVRIALEADAGAPLDGTIAAVDPAIEAATRSIRLRADVPNQDTRLRPGMFVNVTVVLPEKASRVTVAATAVVHAPYGDSVFVVEDKKPEDPGMRTTPDGKTVKVARQQFVRVGPARGDFVAILDGVAAGQEIVTAGAFKLRNGAPVVIDVAKEPKPQLAPRPSNR